MRNDENHLPLIGITMGDPVGIGPEIIVKALSAPDIAATCCPVVLGDQRLLEREISRLRSELKIAIVSTPQHLAAQPGTINLLAISELDPAQARYGQPTRETGAAMAAYITRAVSLAMDRQIDAMVTCPINKKSLQVTGFDFPGHTEMLARLTGAEDVVMMLAGERLRVVLVTIHCPLSRVPGLLSVDAIMKTIRITHQSLKSYFAIKAPRLAIAALNPHAGEGGIFGQEEELIIQPTIAQARQAGIDASGPYPADTLFYHAARGHFDAVVCMYHDQGLIPLKLLHFEDGVNVTLGLPIIRTSVDHGTAYDIAGKGIASPASLLSAVRIAVQMAQAQTERAGLS
jgi:4-hydroxythreonine-4-phosphate dehydrogenase